MTWVDADSIYLRKMSTPMMIESAPNPVIRIQITMRKNRATSKLKEDVSFFPID
jgi:hypothetical protein